ncbi:MAG: hypothetical protein WCE30_10840 [Mycobacterium sp.]
MSFEELSLWFDLDAGPRCTVQNRNGAPCRNRAGWDVNQNGRSIVTCKLHLMRSDLLDGEMVAR